MGLGSSPERDRLASEITMNSLLTPAQQRQYQDPGLVRKILSETKTIAMVGLSPDPQRPSHFVATYLQYEGYRVIPVNPRASEILGEKSYPDLRSIPFAVDMVDVFRRPEECVEIAKQAIEIGAKSLWFQLLVINLEAAQLAQDAGLQVIVDRCVKMEHGRYNGSLHWVGMNTELISARKAQRYF
ncbi:MAG: CoA-binding protein [Caldilineaceae bacterium]